MASDDEDYFPPTPSPPSVTVKSGPASKRKNNNTGGSGGSKPPKAEKEDTKTAPRGRQKKIATVVMPQPRPQTTTGAVSSGRETMENRDRENKTSYASFLNGRDSSSFGVKKPLPPQQPSPPNTPPPIKKEKTSVRISSPSTSKPSFLGSTSGSKVKLQRVTLDTDEEDPEDDTVATPGFHISDILSKLGNELQQRMKAKRRKIEECFNVVHKTPGEIVETLQNHSLERGKVIKKFQEKAKEIVQKVNDVFEMQKQTEEKLNKMMLHVQKHFDSTKDNLNSCVTGLKDIIKQFEQETKDLEGRQDEESRKQLEQITKELGELQKRILREGQEDEAATIRNHLRLV